MMPSEESRKIPKLTQGQRRFLERWASLPFLTIASTAETVGLKPKTAYTWREESWFVDLCEHARAAKAAEIGAEAEALLRENIVPLMQAKIDTALHGTDRERDSAQTWALEHALGKGEAVNKHDVTSGGKGLSEILLDVLSRPVSITVPEDQNPFDAEH